MILSCPACRTQFRVDPALLGPDGRNVRCATCTHVWKVGPDGAPVPTGQFGMKSAKAPAPTTATPETPTQPQPAPQGGSVAVTKAAPAARLAETAATATEAAKDGEGAESPAPEAPTTPEAAAGAAVRAVRQARARKGGRKFRIFLLLVCLAVIALFMAGVITGRIGLGGLSPRPQVPSTGDVAPPASDVTEQQR